MLKGLASAMIGTIAILAVLGILVGADLDDIEILNPTTSAAGARSVDAHTHIELAESKLEIEQRRAEGDAKRAADALDLEHQAMLYAQEEKRGQVELEHHKAILAEELAFRRKKQKIKLRQEQEAFERQEAMKEIRLIVVLGVGSGVAVAIALATTYYLYASARARL